jgi:hypothetical protein
MTPKKREIKRIPRDERSRSELTLLYELIKRNPDRAKIYLERLREGGIAV